MATLVKIVEPQDHRVVVELPADWGDEAVVVQIQTVQPHELRYTTPPTVAVEQGLAAAERLRRAGKNRPLTSKEVNRIRDEMWGESRRESLKQVQSLWSKKGLTPEEINRTIQAMRDEPDGE